MFSSTQGAPGKDGLPGLAGRPGERGSPGVPGRAGPQGLAGLMVRPLVDLFLLFNVLNVTVHLCVNVDPVYYLSIYYIYYVIVIIVNMTLAECCTQHTSDILFLFRIIR